MTLQRIKSPDFLARVGYELPAEAMYIVLRRMPEYGSFRQEHQNGEITDDALRSYVAELLAEFRRGQKFRFDVALAFLAIALEPVFSSFVNEFLNDLAALRLVEMPLSPRVARLVLGKRSQLADNSQREFMISKPQLSHGRTDANASLHSRNERPVEIEIEIV